MAVCSLGEGGGGDGELAGTGLELLGDTYVMCGDLAERHQRDGQLSTWWLKSPGIDVEAFTARLATTYQVMFEAFDAPAHPSRVFLRTHPHRGANASAHPASFVMAMNPTKPLDEASLYETIAHELVHEWLHLDGPAEEVTWFVEGAADYYSLVLPFRIGMLDEEAFLHAVNFEAREGYANPRRNLSLRQAQGVFFSDFLAHRLPYARGMFYLADLDARLSGRPQATTASMTSSGTCCVAAVQASASASNSGARVSKKSCPTPRCRSSTRWSSPASGDPAKTASGRGLK
jgi:predicted metalloprotease with PDZ domain